MRKLLDSLLAPLLLAHVTTHPIKISEFATKHHTRVETCGKVVYNAREADGDWHFRISDGKNFVVCEIMPDLDMPHPRINDNVCAEGIRRFDDEVNHGWWEVHPVIHWRKQ